LLTAERLQLRCVFFELCLLLLELRLFALAALFELLARLSARLGLVENTLHVDHGELSERGDFSGLRYGGCSQSRRRHTQGEHNDTDTIENSMRHVQMDLATGVLCRSER